MSEPTFRHERPKWLADDEELPEVNHVVIASDQITEAMMDLRRPASAYLDWPFAELADLTGPMAPGNVWFVASASGGGKTTFIASAIEHWRNAQKKVYVMPLEIVPKEFRGFMACLAANVHPGDILSGMWTRMGDEGHALRAKVEAEYSLQLRRPYVDTLMISGQRAINLDGLERGLKEAKAFGADVIIVDHIDHIETDETDGKSTLYGEAKKINQRALRMAQDNEMLLVFTSQLNMSHSRGDALTKYLPPRDENVLFGGLKRQIATGMIGLFRPLRSRRPEETEDEYVKAIKLARSGEGNVMDALEPNTMGVVAMKLRNYGAREGGKVMLSVKHGRVFDYPERDRWETHGRYPRKVV